MPTFSEHTETKMSTLMKDFASQVGSHYGGPSGGKSPTDCITYCRQVLEYSCEQVNEPDHVRGVHSRYEKGIEQRILSSTVGSEPLGKFSTPSDSSTVFRFNEGWSDPI